MARRTLLAWLVHLYTALGAVLSGWAILAIFGGDFRLGWSLIFFTIVIDSTDGVLARRMAVKTVLPHFDGRRLDDIVDYLCWVFVPVLLLVEAGMLPAWAAAFPLLASGYGFAQEEAKTSDDYFLGFPSYWSVVAFILYAFAAPAQFVTPLVLFLSVMVFVPIRYPYPTQTRTLRGLTIGLGVPYAALWVVAVWLLPARPRWVALALCAYPAYYAALTLYLAWQRRHGAYPHGGDSATSPGVRR